VNVPIEALLWDLDGLLTDTEPLHLAAYQGVFAAEGHRLDPADYARIWIRDGGGVADYLREAGLPGDIDGLRAAKHRRYAELVRREARCLPGARELLVAASGRKRQALASSAWRHAVDAVLNALDLRRHFAAVVCGDEVPRVKPAPDLSLAAARLLGVAPAACLVLEDAEKGVRAALAAGMRCLAVPTAQTRDHDFSGATAVVDSLAGIDLAFLDTLR
jgi:HAD superfamily hydrolase (TIGR01509 family)